MAKGKTSFLSKLLIFLFGFLFAIVLEAGLIIGGAIVISNMEIDQIFTMVGMENADENGNQYVNTDPENGGYKTPVALIEGVVSMFANLQDMTVADVEKTFPATGSLVDSVNDALSPYVEIDVEELKTTKFLDFGTYLQDLLMGIEPARLLEGLEMGDVISSNVIIEAILVGTEFDYVYDGTNKFPVYYTDYEKIDMGAAGHEYFTKNTDTPYPLDDESWLVDIGNDTYRVYFYDATISVSTDDLDAKTYYVTDQNFTYFNPPTAYALSVAEEDLNGTGYYYYDNSGDKIQQQKITLSTIMSGAFEPLTAVNATDLLDPEGDDALIQEAFAGVTIADILTGNINLDAMMNKLRLPAIMDVYDDNAILKYIAYNVTDAVQYQTVQTASDGSLYTQKGTYSDGANEYVCYLNSDVDGLITEVFYLDGGVRINVKGVSVADVSSQIENLTNALRITDVLGEVDPSNKIMAYMCYSLVNIQPASGQDYAYTATHSYYTPSEVHLYEQCYVYTKTVGGKTVVDKVVSADTGEEILSVHISQISSQVNHLTTTIEVGDIIHIDSDDSMLVKLQHSTIGSLSEDMKALTIQEIYCLDVYGASEPTLATTYSPYYIYYTLTESGYFKSVGKLTQQQFNGDTYYTYGAPKGVWTLLLCEPKVVNGVKYYDDVPCAVNQMYALIQRMKANIDQATLYELESFGILTDDENNLDTVVPLEKKIAQTESDKVAGYKYAYDATAGVFYTYELKAMCDCTVNELVGLIDTLTSIEYATWLATAN